MFFNDLVIRLCFLNVICYSYGAVAPDTKTKIELCKAQESQCEANVGKAHRPVCGSDGRTYPSKCPLLRAQCSGEAIALVHKGPCLEPQSSCLIARRYVLNAQGGRRATFVPKCRADGTYAAVQCSAGSAAGGCWCVAPGGKPLPGTAVRNGRPDCTRTGKSHTRRRSSVRGQRNKKGCSRADRAQFNSNLMKIFRGELERSRGSQPKTPVEPRSVADWKFQELDRDRSGALLKPEYRGLRRLIKKVVKPKRCARSWVRGCDGDGDGTITRDEWINCLLSTPQPPAPDYDEKAPAPAPEPDYGEEEPPLDPSSVLPGTLVRQTFATDAADMETRRDDEVNDCLTDRQAVLDEQRAGGGGAAMYVPECTGDGRYARAQCYRSTPYCWCVHQDTGKPIPGSAVKDSRPDCDVAPLHSSPMKGCPEPMKSNFLKEVKNFFVSKMTSSTNGTVPGDMVKWGAAKEEQAATWTFVMLDKDKNKLLERREWKAFHQLIFDAEPLRRCGRKLPRYCDVNHDSKISITEWLGCLEVVQTTQKVTTEATKPWTHSRRKGPNPLESILKADD